VAYPESRTVELKDVEGYQTLPLPFDTDKVMKYRDKMIKEYIASHRKEFTGARASLGMQDFFFLKFSIGDVYPGSKWDDTCLADLLFTNKEGPSFIPANEMITSVEENEDGDTLFVTTAGGKKYVLQTLAPEETDEGTVLSVASVSSDSQWAVIDIMTGGAGRDTQESYRLFYLPLLTEVPPRVLGNYGLGEPLDFEDKDGVLFVVFSDGEREAAEILEDMVSLRRSSFFHRDTVAKE